MNTDELMDINEAIKRIEYEIEDDLRNKEVTIAGRIDIERIKQMQAELDNKDKQLEEANNEIKSIKEYWHMTDEILQKYHDENSDRKYIILGLEQQLELKDKEIQELNKYKLLWEEFEDMIKAIEKESIEREDKAFIYYDELQEGNAKLKKRHNIVESEDK